jgi:hypothetical protein
MNTMFQTATRSYSSTLSLISAIHTGGLSTPRSGYLPPGKRPGTHCTGVSVGQRPVLLDVENLDPKGVQSPDRTAPVAMCVYITDEGEILS